MCTDSVQTVYCNQELRAMTYNDLSDRSITFMFKLSSQFMVKCLLSLVYKSTVTAIIKGCLDYEVTCPKLLPGACLPTW